MKPKLNETPLFKQVSAAIGEYNAFVELGRVRKAGKTISWYKSLKRNFNWKMSPQGKDFWSKVNDG